jgi:hypothetical protein
MPRFKEATAAVLRFSTMRIRLPETPRTAQAAAAHSAAAEKTESPRADKDYDAIAGALLAKMSRASSSGALTWRELRDAAWCLWTTEPALASGTASLHAVVRSAEVCERRQPARALAASYMASFGRDRPGIEVVARTLMRVAPRMGRPWTDLHNAYSVFNLIEGPANVARHALENRVLPSDILRHSGLGQFDAQSGFARAASAEALRQIASGHSIGHDERLELVRKIGLKNNRTLQFQDQAPLVAEALTRPFGATMPDKATKDSYLELLIGLFGDPRLKPGSWTRMAESEAIVRKWLTEQSLRQFLDVVDRVAPVQKWKYRRAFWECAYNSGIIDEAWVVFEHACAGEARRVFGSTVSFARFNSRGSKTVQNGHAVILMRVGRSLIADWSHDGRCNIWDDAEAKTAPKLNKTEYSSDEVQHPSLGINVTHGPYFSISHNNPQNYTWQRRVAAKIKSLTGVHLPESCYRVVW